MSSRLPDWMPALPSDWQAATIDQLAIRVGSGVTPTGGSEVYTEAGVTFIRSQNVTNQGLSLEDVAFIDGRTHQQMSASEVYPFDVLLNITGASIGRCCFLPEGIGTANVNQHVCAIRFPKPGFHDAKFLASVLASPIGQSQIFRLNAGGNREGLNYQQLRSFKVPWPPKKTRETVAEILTTVDEAMEQTEALVGKLEQMKAGLMHDLFTRGVTPDGHLRPTRQESPHLYHPTPLGWLPKEWEVVTTEDCAAKVPGSTTIGPFGSDLVSGDYQTEGVPVVFVRDVKEDGFEWNSGVYVTERKAERLRAHAVRPGDILSTKMGLPPCISCRYPEWMAEGIVTADIIRLRPDLSLVNPEWLAAVLNGEAFKRQVQTITAGVTRPKVTLGDYRKLRVARPLLDEQNLIAERLASHNRLAEAELEKLAKLRQQKQGLMQDLLTGQVPV